MVDAVYKAGVANMVWYNYRRIPAVTRFAPYGSDCNHAQPGHDHVRRLAEDQ
jgi:hypothetical protein